MPNYTTNVAESALTSTSLITVTAGDIDATTNAEVLYIIDSGIGKDDFTINPNTGEVFVQRALDRETRPQYSLIVGAVDQGPVQRTGYADLFIEIDDVNDNDPIFTSPTFTGEVFENDLNSDVFIGTPAVLLYITATDADIGNNSRITYEIVGATEFSISTFSINGSYRGVISTAVTLDSELQDQHVLTVRALDQPGRSSPTLSQVIINVIDRDDNVPMFTQDVFQAVLYENGDVDELVTNVSAREVDITVINSQIRFRIQAVKKFGEFTFILLLLVSRFVHKNC